jgi:hypothetical protein
MKIPVDYKLVEEAEAEAFAIEIAEYVRARRFDASRRRANSTVEPTPWRSFGPAAEPPHFVQS